MAHACYGLPALRMHALAAQHGACMLRSPSMAHACYGLPAWRMHAMASQHGACTLWPPNIAHARYGLSAWRMHAMASQHGACTLWPPGMVHPFSTHHFTSPALFNLPPRDTRRRDATHPIPHPHIHPQHTNAEKLHPRFQRAPFRKLQIVCCRLCCAVPPAVAAAASAIAAADACALAAADACALAAAAAALDSHAPVPRPANKLHKRAACCRVSTRGVAVSLLRVRAQQQLRGARVAWRQRQRVAPRAATRSRPKHAERGDARVSRAPRIALRRCHARRGRTAAKLAGLARLARPVAWPRATQFFGLERRVASEVKRARHTAHACAAAVGSGGAAGTNADASAGGDACAASAGVRRAGLEVRCAAARSAAAVSVVTADAPCTTGAGHAPPLVPPPPPLRDKLCHPGRNPSLRCSSRGLRLSGTSCTSPSDASAVASAPRGGGRASSIHTGPAAVCIFAPGRPRRSSRSGGAPVPGQCAAAARSSASSSLLLLAPLPPPESALFANGRRPRPLPQLAPSSPDPEGSGSYGWSVREPGPELSLALPSPPPPPPHAMASASPSPPRSPAPLAAGTMIARSQCPPERWCAPPVDVNGAGPGPAPPPAAPGSQHGLPGEGLHATGMPTAAARRCGAAATAAAATSMENLEGLCPEDGVPGVATRGVPGRVDSPPTGPPASMAGDAGDAGQGGTCSCPRASACCCGVSDAGAGGKGEAAEGLPAAAVRKDLPASKAP
eukprot:349608-Chlamydomonas_euryale.AAC.6